MKVLAVEIEEALEAVWSRYATALSIIKLFFKNLKVSSTTSHFKVHLKRCNKTMNLRGKLQLSHPSLIGDSLNWTNNGNYQPHLYSTDICLYIEYAFSEMIKVAFKWFYFFLVQTSVSDFMSWQKVEDFSIAYNLTQMQIHFCFKCKQIAIIRW